MAFASSSRLTLKGANHAVAMGIAEAEKLGFKVCVAVTDAGGNLLALQRMDGTMPVSSEVATGKALSAIKFARATALLEGGVNGAKSNGGERTALLSAGYILMEGGIPIVDPAHGGIIGAVGVSGVKPNEDAQVCKAAVDSLSATSKL
mmetsp:Transcript_46512/g.137443  ORF Transcript_46512/g.137443 Transcript_46512/m.137443 type:complete len:148 (-) Transcript_46512:40-483(-)